MRFGICVYRDDIPSAERAGYDFVELTVTNVLPDVGVQEYRRLKEQLKSFSLKPEAWRRFIPPDLHVVGPTVDLPKLTEFMRITMGRISELGGEVIVFGSPISRNVPEGFSRDKARQQLIRFLQTAADIAKHNNLVIVLEPIIRSNCNVLNTISETFSLYCDVARREIKMLADLYHMSGNLEPPQAVEQTGDSLFHVHMPIPEIPGLNEPRAINTILPNYPIEAFLRSLKKIGFDNRISIEDLDRKFMNLDREASIVLSHVRRTWEDLAL